MPGAIGKPKPVVVVGPPIEVDFGDQELVIAEFSDGRFTVSIDGARLLLTTDNMQQLVGAFSKIGKDKRWT